MEVLRILNQKRFWQRALIPLLLTSTIVVSWNLLAEVQPRHSQPPLMLFPSNERAEDSFLKFTNNQYNHHPSSNHGLMAKWLAFKTVNVSTTTHPKKTEKTVLLVGFPKERMEDPIPNYCPEMTGSCTITHEPGLLSSVAEFDAIAFKVSNMVNRVRDDLWLLDFPRSRSTNQIYVFYSREAPLEPHNFIYGRNRQAREFPYSIFEDYFNWTWTYRQDSDIVDHYELVYPIGWTASNYSEYTNYMHNHQWKKYNSTQFRLSLPSRSGQFKELANKPGKVAWIVSHCFSRSRRHMYALELQKHIEVEILGGCGQKIEGTKIWANPIIFSNFKFYLAFENSICKDYVTEKVFQRLGHILPVVMGGADYAKVLPPHSYIDAAEHSPAELAQLLHRLDQEPEEYLSYFWWVDHYQLTTHVKNAFGLCQLCSMLISDPEERRRSVDLEKWWWEGSQCKEYQHWWPPPTVTGLHYSASEIRVQD